MTDLSQYGVLGAVVIALAAYVLLIEKRHRDERETWGRQNERLSDEMNKNIKENTSILSSLKTLLENRR